MKCPKNMVYAYNTSACQPSCSDQKPVCTEGFMEGCVCKHGYILSGQKCVPIASCGCTFDGMYLNVIMTFPSFRLLFQTASNINHVYKCLKKTHYYYL